MRAVLAGLMLAGCASASSQDNTTVTIGGKPDAGGLHHIDAPEGEQPEAGIPVDAFVPPIDAAPGMMTKTVSGTNSDTAVEGNSPACTDNTNGGTRASTYYRAFDLSKFGITSDFNVSSVTFAVEDCYNINGNGAVVAVRVGTYDGTAYGMNTLPGPITILASNNTVQVPQLDMTVGTVTAPISATIPAGKKLIVEVDVPDGSGVFELFMGSNTQGETAPSYFTAAACNFTTPTDPGTATSPPTTVDMIITATGTYQP